MHIVVAHSSVAWDYAIDCAGDKKVGGEEEEGRVNGE